MPPKPVLPNQQAYTQVLRKVVGLISQQALNASSCTWAQPVSCTPSVLCIDCFDESLVSTPHEDLGIRYFRFCACRERLSCTAGPAGESKMTP
ncbi:hypothetical protein C0Q70_09979 [Pomacea canaliculata]|uniref:Uncharacterized protein n=1 Tax=Pomacea canaliculata TaxID=400727 RepID=A0A2T7PBA1_POMCA|nr:hypothetical protein C0Q70_09979 [Pomacea canaliculata]